MIEQIFNAKYTCSVLPCTTSYIISTTLINDHPTSNKMYRNSHAKKHKKSLWDQQKTNVHIICNVPCTSCKNIDNIASITAMVVYFPVLHIPLQRPLHLTSPVIYSPPHLASPSSLSQTSVPKLGSGFRVIG